MEETIRRVKCLYEQQREKPTFRKAWDDQKKFKKEHRQRETNLPFSETVLREIHHLERREWLKWGNKGRDRRPFSVGDVKRTTSTKIVHIKMEKQEMSIMFNKMKQWRTWAV
jgi:hypothetical protein